VPAIATDVNAERQAELLRALIDRPVAAAPQRLIGARADIDLHIAADFGAAFNFGDRQLRVVLAGEDRGLQPRLAVGPERQLPVVDSALDRGAEFEVLLREDEEIEHLVEVGMRMDARMHVAINDAQPVFGGDFFRKNGTVDDITHAILLG
jgi:hypothetical protein